MTEKSPIITTSTTKLKKNSALNHTIFGHISFKIPPFAICQSGKIGQDIRIQILRLNTINNIKNLTLYNRIKRSLLDFKISLLEINCCLY